MASSPLLPRCSMVAFYWFLVNGIPSHVFALATSFCWKSFKIQQCLLDDGDGNGGGGDDVWYWRYCRSYCCWCCLKSWRRRKNKTEYSFQMWAEDFTLSTRLGAYIHVFVYIFISLISLSLTLFRPSIHPLPFIDSLKVIWNPRMWYKFVRSNVCCIMQRAYFAIVIAAAAAVLAICMTLHHPMHFV